MLRLKFKMDLNKDLTCKICNKIFENPVFLSCCEENACKEHMLEPSTIQRCPLCSESLPKQKLPINKVLKNLIDDRKIQDFSIDSEYKDELESFKLKIKTIEGIHRDPYSIIHKKFLELRNQVDLDRGKVKLEVDKLADGLIKDLNESEEILKYESRSFENHNDDELMKNIYNQLTDYEKSLTIFNDSERKNKIEGIKMSVSLLENVIDIYEKNLFKNYLIKHEPSQIDIIKSNFGKLIKSLKNARLIQTLNGLPGPVSSLASLENENLAWAGGDSNIKIYNIKEGSTVQTLNKYNDYCQEIKILRLEKDYLVSSTSSKIIVFGHRNNNFRGFGGDNHKYCLNIWNLKEGKEIQTLEGHSNAISSLAYKKDSFLASGSTDGKIILWSVGEAKLIQTLEEHECNVKALIYLENGYLASGSEDGRMKIWDVKTRSVLMSSNEHSGSINSLLCLKNGSLASASSDCTIKIWGIDEGELFLLKTLMQHSSPVKALALLNNDLLASGYADGRIGIWNIKYDSLVKLFVAPEAHLSSVNALAVLDNGYLASGSDDRTIKIWDI